MGTTNVIQAIASSLLSENSNQTFRRHPSFLRHKKSIKMTRKSLLTCVTLKMRKEQLRA